MDRKQLEKPEFTVPALMCALCVLLLASRGVLGREYDDAVTFYLAIIICQTCVFVLPSALFCRLRNYGGVGEVGLNFCSPRGLPAVFAALGVMVFGCSLLRFGIFYFGYDAATYNVYGASYALSLSSVSDVIYAVFAFALLPAATEEFVFRGIMFREFSGQGKLFTAVVTSLFFAAVHFSPSEIPVYFFAGLILAWVRFLTDSTLACVLLHFLYNIFSLFIQKYIWLISSGAESERLFWLVMVALLLLFVTLLCACAVKLSTERAVRREPAPVRGDGFFKSCGRLVGSFGFIIFVVIFILVLLIIS